MAKFTTPRKIETIKYFEKTVEIFRTVKTGTKRVFFFPQTSDGKRLNRTMFARKGDAMSLGRHYLKTDKIKSKTLNSLNSAI